MTRILSLVYGRRYRRLSLIVERYQSIRFQVREVYAMSVPARALMAFYDSWKIPGIIMIQKGSFYDEEQEKMVRGSICADNASGMQLYDNVCSRKGGVRP